MHDYLLGGYHNLEIDRQMVDQLLAFYPEGRLSAHASRAFLRRVVRFLVAQGIDQFLDIGSGIPTAGNVHETAQALNPAAHVVYVDIDPVAVAHSRAILAENRQAIAIQGDARQPGAILAHPGVQDLLDWDRPVAVLLLNLLHYVVDDQQAQQVVRTLSDALVPGSYIAISHGTRDGATPEQTARAEQIAAASRAPNRYRSHDEILALFAGLDLVEPGLVYLPLWHPEGPDDVLLNEPVQALIFGGVGRKGRVGRKP
ncbi:MAG: SAM-dependent methyltransferase [Chloroflexi bacterium]|nr:SAM-dependent methyltransferase [Chloroflexota bacterium]MBU1748063.1 SAM-dependent methyltransferase [Chloroflexota bacterium]